MKTGRETTKTSRRIRNAIVAVLLPIVCVATAGFVSADELLWWNRLGNVDEVLNPPVGTPPVIDGAVAFIPGYFGDAYAPLGGYTSDRIYIPVSGLQLNPEAGMMEAWVMYPNDPIVQSFGYSMFGLIDGPYQETYDPLIGNQNFVYMGDGTQGVLYTYYVSLNFTGTGPWPIELEVPNADTIFHPGEWHHIALVWDRAGIDGSAECVRFYIVGSVHAAATENNWGDLPDVGNRHAIGQGDNRTGSPAYGIDNLKVWDYAAVDSIEHRFEEDWIGAEPTLTLNSDLDCYPMSEPQLTVGIDMTDIGYTIVAGQYFLEYDNTVLDFVSIEPGDSPFTNEIYEGVDEGAGTIDYAVGVEFGDPGTDVDTTMARITFEFLQDVCTPTADLVTYRTHDPPTRLTRMLGQGVDPVLVNLNPIKIDQTPPVFDTFPSDVDLHADAGVCTLTLTTGEIGEPTASDNCGGIVLIEWSRDDLAPNIDDPFAGGTTTITWTATDECGNTTVQDQYVTVSDQNELHVAVELDDDGGNIVIDPGPFDRCIKFELFETGCGGGSVIVEEVLTFTDRRSDAVITVPCGSYECITALDVLHTLRRTDDDGDFTTIIDTPDYYVCDFTATTGTTDDSLIGGNYYKNDAYIDILDFAVLVHEWAENYGPDTDCSTPWPHADGSGDGTVEIQDFRFIRFNFLHWGESNCCGLGPNSNDRDLFNTPNEPITSITIEALKSRGLDQLIKADLDKNGVLDVRDVEAFRHGARP